MYVAVYVVSLFPLHLFTFLDIKRRKCKEKFFKNQIHNAFDYHVVKK